MADTTAASKVEEHPEAPAAVAEDGTPVRTVSLFRENTRVATAVAALGAPHRSRTARRYRCGAFSNALAREAVPQTLARSLTPALAAGYHQLGRSRGLL